MFRPKIHVLDRGACDDEQKMLRIYDMGIDGGVGVGVGMGEGVSVGMGNWAWV